MLVTDRACARSAPSTRLADLERSVYFMISPKVLSDNSGFIENLFRHKFTFDVTRYLLRLTPHRFLTVSRSEVDNAGVDLVLQLGSVTRHVQMKTLSRPNGSKPFTRNPYAIAESLEDIPGACVIWLCYVPDTLDPCHYHILGGRGNSMMKKIRSLPQTEKRKKDGTKSPRNGYRNVMIPYADLKTIDLESLIVHLFDIKTEQGAAANP